MCFAQSRLFTIMEKLEIDIFVVRTFKAGFFDPETHIALAFAHGYPDAALPSINFHHSQSSSLRSLRVSTKQKAPYSIDLLHADARRRAAVIAHGAAVKSKAGSLRRGKKAFDEEWTWKVVATEFPSVTLEDPDVDRLWR
jgi:hypothetical protein